MRRKLQNFLLVMFASAVLLPLIAAFFVFVLRPDHFYNVYSSIPAMLIDLPLQQSFTFRNMDNADRLIRRQMLVSSYLANNETQDTSVQKNIGLFERNSLSKVDFESLVSLTNHYLSKRDSGFVRGLSAVGVLYGGKVGIVDIPEPGAIEDTKFKRYYEALRYIDGNTAGSIVEPNCQTRSFIYRPISRQKDNDDAALSVVNPKLVVESTNAEGVPVFSEYQALVRGTNELQFEVAGAIDSLAQFRVHMFAPPGTIVRVVQASLDTSNQTIELSDLNMFLRSGFFIDEREFILVRPSELVMFLSRESVKLHGPFKLRLKFYIRSGKPMESSCE
jgi:hypothetical protein